jgi:hypothetical protein
MSTVTRAIRFARANHLRFVLDSAAGMVRIEAKAVPSRTVH